MILATYGIQIVVHGCLVMLSNSYSRLFLAVADIPSLETHLIWRVVLTRVNLKGECNKPVTENMQACE